MRQSLPWTVLVWLLMTAFSVANAESTRPNVVVFLADDAGWGDYSRNGNTMVRTPHIDSDRGRWRDAGSVLCLPVCAPTRLSFSPAATIPEAACAESPLGRSGSISTSTRLPTPSKPRDMPPGRSANGTTDRNGRITRWLAGSMNTSDTAPGTGANTSTPAGTQRPNASYPRIHCDVCTIVRSTLSTGTKRSHFSVMSRSPRRIRRGLLRPVMGPMEAQADWSTGDRS